MAVSSRRKAVKDMDLMKFEAHGEADSEVTAVQVQNIITDWCSKPCGLLPEKEDVSLKIH